MDLILFIVGFIGLGVSIVLLVINIVKKKPKRNPLIGLALCIVLMITGLSMPDRNDDKQISKQDISTEDIKNKEEKPAYAPDNKVDYRPLHKKKEDKDLNKEEPEKESLDKEPAKNEPIKNEPTKELVIIDRKVELEGKIKSRINDGDYKKVSIDKITINDNLGTETDGDYIALVYLNFDVINTRKTGNTMMRKYSDDLAATLANQDIKDISEIAVFWTDEYNGRDVKYAYEYKDGKFFVMDIAGE